MMGPSGQAQMLARDLRHAFQILADHHDLATIVPGERTVRPRPTADLTTRDVTLDPYTGDEGFSTIGEVFTLKTERKKPFAMRELMRSVVDRDAPVLERFADVRHGETVITWDTHLGGHAVTLGDRRLGPARATLAGIESRPIPRRGWVPVHPRPAVRSRYD